MSQHTSVSNCFYYVITIALSVINDCLICIELCVFDLKSQERLFMRKVSCQSYKTISQSQQRASESTILHIYSNRAF